MPTINAPEFDYQTYMKENPPDLSKLQRGSAARHQRRETSKGRITIWIDHEVLEQFKQLVPDGQGYQSLINQALREWLAARGVKELVREALQEMTAQVVSTLSKASAFSAPK
jgi:uncharacterized protein (DUF4415 family)